MSARLRHVRELGAESARNPAGPTLGWMTRAGMASAAAVGVVLVTCLFTPASSAQIVVAGNSPAGGIPAVEWAGFAGNAQHTAVASVLPQPFKRIRWQAKVDRNPYVQGQITSNYGSPMITAANTVLVPTRVSARAGFRVIAYSGSSGVRRWSLDTDYRPSVYPYAAVNGTPALPAVLTPSGTLAVAGAGGTVLMRGHANLRVGPVRRLVFYGTARWKAHRSAYDKAVQITTPLTAATDGSVYFGFTVNGATPTRLTSGIARIDADGRATWITAAAASGNRAFNGVAIGGAPALSPDGKTLYITVTSPIKGKLSKIASRGILIGLNASTLRPRFHVALKDPVTGRPALIITNSTASPTVGPDGDVYYGVLENPLLSHDDRGWLLHFNATLTRTKIPGSFGWDNTVSVLPARAVPGYHGTSPYLLVSKYNNYYDIGPHGNGRNRVAVLDPRSSQKDPYANIRTMKAVETILSPVHEPGDPAGARYEWCINSAAVDTADDSVIVNNEDGMLYRWDLATNTLAERIRLNKPYSEPYTPTVIGPDGTVYAINNATLYAIGR
jgi:WD40-like Beta Propeller Repeat